LGFADAREFAPVFYSHRLRDDGSDRHAADRNMALIRALETGDTTMDFSIALTSDDRIGADAIVREAGIDRSDGFAVLVPSTRWETKCWPADRFGQTAARLGAEAGLRSILVGGRDDVGAGERAARAAGGAAFNACGRTTLRQLAALIAAAR